MRSSKSGPALSNFLLLSILLWTFFALAGQSVPLSVRAKEAIRRVEPRLRNDFGDAGLVYGSPIYIRIFKEEKELEVWVRENKKFVLLKTYPVCTYGGGSLGPKTRKGDGQAPEGFYYVGPSQLNPLSSYHLAFNIGYPNKYDKVHKRTGSAIMVHGNCVSIGCFAMTDGWIEEIYAMAVSAFKNGQSFFRVHIFPFRMTETNMKKHNRSEWYPFWQNLKKGYDFFYEYGNVPPNVEVDKGRYVFNRSR